MCYERWLHRTDVDEEGLKSIVLEDRRWSSLGVTKIPQEIAQDWCFAFQLMGPLFIEIRCTSPGAWTNFDNSANAKAKSGRVIITRKDRFAVSFHSASEIFLHFAFVGAFKPRQQPFVEREV
mmetsp:Transcript_29634/g.60845  ORF Transcript_29634/g.60845 Transcript_29634/m.60845 type:complete len:122 (+) Transcript_29634:184-549(+)